MRSVQSELFQRGSFTGSEALVNRDLRLFARRIEESAHRDGLLQGAYFLHMEPVENLRGIEVTIEARLRDYLSRTSHVAAAKREILRRHSSSRCTTPDRFTPLRGTSLDLATLAARRGVGVRCAIAAGAPESMPAPRRTGYEHWSTRRAWRHRDRSLARVPVHSLHLPAVGARLPRGCSVRKR